MSTSSAQAGTGDGYCVPVRAGPSLGDASIRSGPEARGRFDPVCGKSSKEISRHLSAGFRVADWQGLWDALKEVFPFWAEHGVRIFRVDNPHTKAFPFWEWVIAEVKAVYPDAIFLAEAFTRPRVMERLGKLGLYADLHLLHLAND